MTTAVATSFGLDQFISESARIYNFSAGPAVLPEEVIQQAQRDLWSIAGSGIGIMEHSHRGKVFDRVIDEAVADCRKLGNIGDDYEVLFLQGGATLQFAMVPMSFLSPEASADYLDTGEWTSKAIKEAKLFGKVNVAFDGSKTKYDHVPEDKELKLDAKAVYTWYCSNNTVFGTRYAQPPRTTTPLVADTSSEMFGRPMDINRHALIFAGAQKNLGPSGVVLVIIRKDFMAKSKPNLPSMLSYPKQAEQGSRLNTPPTFGIYFMGQIFKWLLRNGGLAAMEKRNNAKAAVLYEAIDTSGGFYRGVAKPSSRSMMNVVFRTPSEELDAKFVSESTKNEMDGLKGHRAVGGLRASIYNAFPIEGCRHLAEFMADFARRNG
jgi:phosphoserine aminotransferase